MSVKFRRIKGRIVPIKAKADEGYKTTAAIGAASGLAAGAAVGAGLLGKSKTAFALYGASLGLGLTVTGRSIHKGIKKKSFTEGLKHYAAGFGSQFVSFNASGALIGRGVIRAVAKSQRVVRDVSQPIKKALTR